MLPQISIITVVKNGMPHLKECINSLNKQTLKNFEHIIIYSESNDGTFEFLRKCKKKIIIDKKSRNKFGSLNKGISLAKGKYIGILHADDIFYEKKTLSYVSTILKNEKYDVLYGNLIYFDKRKKSKILRKWISKKFRKSSMLNKGWMPPHTTLFVKKKIIKKNLYTVKFNISGDYDFVLRLFKRKLNFFFLNKFIVKMRYGGDSNKSLKNIFIKMYQDLEILKLNKIKNPIYTLLNKNFSKIGQFIK